MKSILTIITLFLTMSIYSQSTPCPVEGKGKNAKDIAANKLKNRDIVPKTINTKVNLQSILSPGEDSKRFNQDDFVMITGYCVFIERGGKESCNCEASIDTLQDN